MDRNNEWWDFVQSILKMAGWAVPFAIGAGVLASSWIAGIIIFILGIIAQIVDFNIKLEMTQRKNKEAEFLAAQVLKEAAERQLPYNLNCAYCNTLNRVGISFNFENTFECTQCKQPNKVYIQFTTVRLTVPLTQKENVNYIDMDTDAGVEQTTINNPINMSEK